MTLGTAAGPRPGTIPRDPMWLVRNLSSMETPVLVTALVVLFLIVPGVTAALARSRK